MNDTICAIATSQGVGAIAIIRVSGEDSIKIVNKIFKGKDLEKTESHTINYGHITDGDKIIDEVLVSVMKAPILNRSLREHIRQYGFHNHSRFSVHTDPLFFHDLPLLWPVQYRHGVKLF